MKARPPVNDPGTGTWEDDHSSPRTKDGVVYQVMERVVMSRLQSPDSVSSVLATWLAASDKGYKCLEKEKE